MHCTCCNVWLTFSPGPFPVNLLWFTSFSSVQSQSTAHRANKKILWMEVVKEGGKCHATLEKSGAIYDNRMAVKKSRYLNGIFQHDLFYFSLRISKKTIIQNYDEKRGRVRVMQFRRNSTSEILSKKNHKDDDLFPKIFMYSPLLPKCPNPKI